jgi:hypothetical protein
MIQTKSAAQILECFEGLACLLIKRRLDIRNV